MENQDLNQYRNVPNEQVIEPRMHVSKDGKWLIIRLDIDGKTLSIIKPVAYFEKIIETAKKRNVPVGFEKIK